MVIIMVQTRISLTGTQWLKFTIMCGLALLYITAIFSLSMWVSCVTPRPATSVMILVTIWLVLVLAVPNLCPYLAQKLQPTSNPAELETTKMIKTKDIFQSLFEDRMARYDRQHETDDRESEPDAEVRRRRRHERRIFRLECRRDAWLERLNTTRKLDEDFERRLDGQVRLSRWISRVSPFACFAMAAAELTDTGLLNKRYFIDQIRDYQREVAEFGMSEWIRREQLGFDQEGTGEDMPKWPSEDRPVPVFQAREAPTTNEYMRATMLDAGILAGLTLLFSMLSFVSFLRYDVR